jgi:hypothetical protein
LKHKCLIDTICEKNREDIGLTRPEQSFHLMPSLLISQVLHNPSPIPLLWQIWLATGSDLDISLRPAWP